MYILCFISQSKGNQAMKFRQLIEYNKINIVLQNSHRKWGRKTSPRPLFLFSKSSIWGKSKFSFNKFWWPSNWHTIKTNYKTLDYWSRDQLDFDFLEKCLGIVSLQHFVCYFSRKLFFTLYSISWPNFVVWLPLLRYWTIYVLLLSVSKVVAS